MLDGKRLDDSGFFQDAFIGCQKAVCLSRNRTSNMQGVHCLQAELVKLPGLLDKRRRFRNVVFRIFSPVADLFFALPERILFIFVVDNIRPDQLMLT